MVQNEAFAYAAKFQAMGPSAQGEGVLKHFSNFKNKSNQTQRSTCRRLRERAYGQK